MGPPESLKTRIFTFGVAFHFFVAGNRRHFKLNTWVKHSKFQLSGDLNPLIIRYGGVATSANQPPRLLNLTAVCSWRLNEY